MQFKVITPPAVEPVSIVRAKSFLHVDWDDDADDADITSMISAAREWLEIKLGRAFITQTIRLVAPLADLTRAPLSGVLGSNYQYGIVLPHPPCISLTSVEVESDVSVWNALSAEANDYKFDSDSDPARIFLSTTTITLWSLPIDFIGLEPRVRVTYQAGYGATGDSVPDGIKMNILKIVKYLFDHRDESAIPDSLIDLAFRKIRLA